MKFNSATLVGLLVLSSSLALQALSPAQVRKVQEEGQAAIRKGDTKTAQRKIHELKTSGNSGAAVPLERELLEGSLSQLKYTKDSLTKARERLAESGKAGRSSKKEVADQQKRIDELENLLLDTARETSELEELFRNAIRELEMARTPAAPGAGVEAADDATIRAAKVKLDKDLKRVIGNTDVHSLSQIDNVNKFTYLDYKYWAGTLGWNANMTYLYWRNNKLYNELKAKSKEYAEQYKADKNRRSRVYEAAVLYLADLDQDGKHLEKYSARQLLPKDELWKYLDRVEVANYINEVRGINAKKGAEVAALAKKYDEQRELEEREERERQQADAEKAERTANDAAKSLEAAEVRKELENERIEQQAYDTGNNF